MIFLILLMFNIALLFPRTELRIKFVNKFKPFLMHILAHIRTNFHFGQDYKSLQELYSMG